jgi:hypothetical protein
LRQRDLPTYLGQFGAHQTADMDSRERWTHEVCEAAPAPRPGA